MVENRAMTEVPSGQTYYSVVSREIVYLELLIAGLNELDIMVCDIRNAYLNEPC